jgi:hypothetical protein
VVTNDAKDFTRFTDHPGVLVVSPASRRARSQRPFRGSNDSSPIRPDSRCTSQSGCEKGPSRGPTHSTVTLLARFRGLSIDRPSSLAT